MAKDEQQEKRRFTPEKREKWTDEQRAEFLKKAEALKPFIDHLTTPAPKPKPKDWLEELVG
jgi:hypothetical protein